MSASAPSYPQPCHPDERFALAVDAADPLAGYRDSFHIPLRPDGRPVIYFAGNSLGLQPKAVRGLMDQELDDWARLGVEGHFKDRTPWYSYHELFRDSAARLVGATPGEVVLMNSLTINLHLMLVSFYRPIAERFLIYTDSPPFPSDAYALQTHIRHRGYDPGTALRPFPSREGERCPSIDDIERILAERGREIDLVVLNAVNFFTGEFYDVPRITAAAKRHGCKVGLDLAHAIGNVELHLHDWQADFAVWCSYKYLNGGPGAVGGCFVRECHANKPELPRLAGWWGNDPSTRFRMRPAFTPQPGAEGWQVSNPPIFSLVPLRASLALFDAVGMPALRAKSVSLTGYLQYLLDRLPAGRFEVITPRDPARRGCQLSLLIHDRPKELLAALQAQGVVCDFREPNVIRVAPVPLYNSFHDVWQFAQVLARQFA